MSDPAFGRAVSALVDETLARAGKVVPGPRGMVAVLDARWPDSHDNNKVVVTGAVDAADLLEFAESALAGVAHRQVLMLSGGSEVADAARAAGYTVSTLLVMALDRSRTVAPPDPAIDVRTADEATTRSFARTAWRVENPQMPSATVEQLVSRRDAYVAPVVSYLAYVDGVAAAHADLRQWLGLAEVDMVLTLPEYRNRGLARSLVLHAIARAHRDGADLVFLLADADDWPRLLYRRLGFETVGTIHELHRGKTMTSGEDHER